MALLQSTDERFSLPTRPLTAGGRWQTVSDSAGTFFTPVVPFTWSTSPPRSLISLAVYNTTTTASSRSSCWPSSTRTTNSRGRTSVPTGPRPIVGSSTGGQRLVRSSLALAEMETTEQAPGKSYPYTSSTTTTVLPAVRLGKRQQSTSQHARTLELWTNWILVQDFQCEMI